MAVVDDIRAAMGDLTSAERKVANALLLDYPFAGLMTLTELSERAAASPQTILRLVTKLRFSGFGEFQRFLLGELKSSMKGPVELRAQLKPQQAAPGLMQELADRTYQLMKLTVASINQAELDRICNLLGDHSRAIFLLGGRISDYLAGFFAMHLRQVRPRVYKVPLGHEEWPEYLLRMRKRDIVVLFDYRRYQRDILLFAERAHRERKVTILLFTDEWMSPVARCATHVVPAHIDAGTAWDTLVTPLLIVEALISQVSDLDWKATRKRIESWDALRIDAPGRAGLNDRNRKGNKEK